MGNRKVMPPQSMTDGRDLSRTPLVGEAWRAILATFEQGSTSSFGSMARYGLVERRMASTRLKPKRS
jgi:hypothetical protein